MAVIYEFSMIHDVHLKVMAEIKNQWNRMSTEEKASFKKQAKKQSTMVRQQIEKSLPPHQKEEIQMICVYV
jgi:hypothetical protein